MPSAITGNVQGYASSSSPGLVSTAAQTFAGAKTFNDGLIFASSSLSDAQATVLGLKQYLHGTTYNGGNAPTVTCTQAGFANVRSTFLPYQEQSGAWRLKLNITGSFTSTSAAISTVVTINGVTFKNLTDYYQSMSLGTAGSALGYLQRAITVPNTSTISVDVTAGTNVTKFCISGDVELNAKPTWAY